MNGYLGETIVNIDNTEFKDYKPKDWALDFIFQYGGIDGDHHKIWLLDQIVRILKGTKVIIKEAKWEDGEKEYRITLDEPSQKYKDWVKEYENDGEYKWDEGIAP
jgi:hypothetical protein